MKMMIFTNLHAIGRMRLIVLLGFLLSSGCYVSVHAQSVLSLEEAINIAVQNNYQVQISQQSVELAKSNTLLSGVAKKPTLSLSSAVNGNLGDSRTKYFSDPDVLTNSNVPSLDANIAAVTNLLLLDGKRTQYAVDQKKEEELLAQMLLKATKEEIVFAVSNAYYNLARMSENIDLLQSSFAISKKRFQRATYSLEYGTQDKLAVLNAKVDMNRDSIELLKFGQQITNAKRFVNLLLNRDQNTLFDVTMNPQVNASLTYDHFYQLAIDNNVELQLARQNLNISAFDIRLNKSNLKPSVNASASYGVNYLNNTDVNPLDYSLNNALRLGLSLSWPLIDGGRTKYLNEITSLRINTETLRLSQLMDQINVDLSNAWGEYQNALLVLELENSNVGTAEENFVRTQERFNNGQINSISFRQAQLNLLASKLNLSRAKYDIKLLELELMKLSGQIL